MSRVLASASPSKIAPAVLVGQSHYLHAGISVRLATFGLADFEPQASSRPTLAPRPGTVIGIDQNDAL